MTEHAFGSRRTLAAALFVLSTALGLVAACGSDAQVVARQVRDFITNVSTSDGVATGNLVLGAPPDPSGGPEAGVEMGTGTVLLGGGTVTTVSSDVPFATVLLTVGGVEDYYQIQLPVPTTSVDLAVGLAETVPELSFLFEYALVDATGAVGPFVGQPVDMQAIAEAAVQVGVSWPTLADLDLTVTDPTGATIGAGTPTTETGGTFYGNANGGCVRTASSTELVTYAPDEAPTGTYRVEVALADTCDARNGAFVLVVGLAGRQVIVQPGAVSVAPGAPPFVYTFDYEGAPEPGCGDGACSAESGETCSTCAADCGSCDACSVGGSWAGTFSEQTGASGTIVADLVNDGVSVTGTATATVTDCPPGGDALCQAANMTDAAVEGTFDGSAIHLTSGIYTLDGTVQEGCLQASGSFTAGLLAGTWTMSRSGN